MKTNNKIPISHADIVVTHACNKKCEFCIDKFRNSSSQIVSIQDIKCFLELLKEKTYKYNFEFDLNPKIEILLLGGEPTVLGATYLIEIANLIHAYGFEICMSTNGIRKDVIKTILPYFDLVQITVSNLKQINYWLPWKDKVNLKLACDEKLTLEDFENFAENTSDFARRSLTIYFKPDFEELCRDENMLNLLDSLNWKRCGSYLYSYIKGVRVKRCIKGVTNIIDEPLIPKLYPNGNYNKTWLHEDLDDYLMYEESV